MNKYLKILILPLAILVLMTINLSITDNHNELDLSSCVTMFNTAEATVFPPGSIVNGHELVYEYPEAWDAGIVAICSLIGHDCLFEGETPDLYN